MIPIFACVTFHPTLFFSSDHSDDQKLICITYRDISLLNIFFITPIGLWVEEVPGCGLIELLLLDSLVGGYKIYGVFQSLFLKKKSIFKLYILVSDIEGRVYVIHI